MSKPLVNETRPAGLGFSMPAEWAPHEATWLTWPHNPTDWPGKTSAIHWVFADMVRHLIPGEKVRILVTPKTEIRARRILADSGIKRHQVEWFNVPTDRSWIRDYGPIFVQNDQKETACVDFAFNGWGRYPRCEQDDAVPGTLASQLNIPRFKAVADGLRFVLEGGSIDVNGAGLLLTTEQCLLDRQEQARNPDLDRSGIEHALQDHLGVQDICWLGSGLEGDDTHGHVDDLCRFVAEDTVVLAYDHANPVLCENHERLQGFRSGPSSSGKLHVIELPCPRIRHFRGHPLPASYANFYIANQVVLVPTFNDPVDRKALGILQECFPDRTVIGIHAVDLVWGLGAIHCLTQQQPEGTPWKP